MKDLLLCVHVIAKTLNLEISRCHLADHVKELYWSACRTTIFPHSTNQIIVFWRRPCLSSLMTTAEAARPTTNWRDPWGQKFRNFRSRIKWNILFRNVHFEHFCQLLEIFHFNEISGIQTGIFAQMDRAQWFHHVHFFILTNTFIVFRASVKQRRKLTKFKR